MTYLAKSEARGQGYPFMQLKMITSQATELGENDGSGGINREYLENP